MAKDATFWALMMWTVGAGSAICIVIAEWCSGVAGQRLVRTLTLPHIDKFPPSWAILALYPKILHPCNFVQAALRTPFPPRDLLLSFHVLMGWLRSCPKRRCLGCGKRA